MLLPPGPDDFLALELHAFSLEFAALLGTTPAEVVRRHPGLYVIADEIYEHIVFEGRHLSFAALPDMAERTITVNGLSKAFALTGWRVGYGAAPTVLAKALTLLMSQSTTCPSAISQYAAAAALTGGRPRCRSPTCR